MFVPDTMEGFSDPAQYEGFCALRDEARKRLIALCESIDPNWNQARFRWGRDEDRGWALMNCPSRGDVDLSPFLKDVLGDGLLKGLLEHRECVWADIKACAFDEGGCLSLRNPRHEIQLVPGKTKIFFEHCDEAMIVEILDGEGEEFMIEYVGHGDPCDASGCLKERYTLTRLIVEMASDESCVACGFGYAPFLSRG